MDENYENVYVSVTAETGTKDGVLPGASGCPRRRTRGPLLSF